MCGLCEGPADGADAEHSAVDPEAARLGRSLGAQLGAQGRVEVGRMCKRLLDTGRLRYLEAHGYAGRLQTYVAQEVSPENVLLVATPAAA